ncbi:phage tail length tape measure family protein [uncultured Sulfitobacter sp.]|uniref:phage tail length tape measure family protein n=1 Tax=uncultured Sulfitobacter sp. TaxID=191468 RepID=UPI002597B8EA|nr:phage tail length tape measure family protein [uncultured Sulfitobacter sp.]
MASALSKRDIDLIFRAEDRGASRTASELRSQVKGLRKEIADQAAAAERGEGSVEKLRNSYRELKNVFAALKDQQGLIKTYVDLTDKQEKQAVKTEELKAKQASLSAEFAKTDKPTKRLTESLASVERRLTASIDKEEELAAKTKLAAGQLEQAGVSANKWEQAQAGIVATTKETAQALALAGNALNEYDANLERAAAAQRGLEQSARLEGLTSAGSEIQSQIQFMSGLEGQVELLDAEMRKAAGAKNLLDSALASGDVAQAEQRVREYAGAIDQVEAAQQRLQTAGKFKAIANEAAAAATDVDRFSATADKTAGSATRLADAVLKIVDPGRAAAGSISGIEDAVEQAAATLEDGEANAGQYQAAVNELSQAQAGLNTIARDIDGFEKQQRAVRSAEAAYEAAQQEVLQLAGAIQQAEQPTEAMVRELRQAETALDQAGRAMQTEKTKADRMSVALRRAGVETDNLEDEQRRLIGTAKRAGNAMQGLSGKLKGKGAFLNLRPHELQNLGFQINDIFTSLASGQKPVQVLAQQGGQIAQIPGVLKAIASRIPILLALAAALYPVIAAFRRAGESARSLKQVERTMIEVGDTGRYTKEQLLEAVDAIDRLGVSTDEATALVQQFAKDGLDPAQFEDFATAAINTASVYPDFAENAQEAAEKLTEAFAEGKDGILDLDNQLHFLTDAQREQIEAMNGQTQSAEIAELAFDALYGRSQELAEHLEGPMNDATRDLENAWQDLLDAIGLPSPWESIKSFIASTIQTLADFIRWIGNALSSWSNFAAAVGILASGGLGGAVDAAKAQGEARRAADGNSTDPSQRDRTGSGAPKFNRRTTPKAAKKKRGGGKKKSGKSSAEREAEKRQRDIERGQERLQRNLERLEARVAKGSIVPLEQRFDAIDKEYAKLEREIAAFEKLTNGKGKIGDLSIDQYREQVALNKQALREQTELKFREEEINAELKARKLLLEQIEDDYNRGSISAAEASDRAFGVLTKSEATVKNMTQEALKFARALNSVKPSPKLDAFIAKLEGIQADASKPYPESDSAVFSKKLYEDAEKKLNEIIATRNEQVRIALELYEAGAISHEEKEQRIQAAYKNTQVEIEAQIAAIEELMDVLGPEGLGVSATTFQTMKDKIAQVKVEMKQIPGLARDINQSIRDNVAEGLQAAFDAAAESIAGLIDGTKSVGDFFKSMGEVALQTLSNILKGVADLIVQMLILKAIKALFGEDVGSGGIGGFFSKIFHDGGVVGQAGAPSRKVSPALFAQAPRYHGGGIAGLRPGEIPAILKAGEEVLTADDPNHIANRVGGGGGDALKSLKIVNTFDTGDVVSEGASTQSGERAILNVIRKNPSVVKQALA